MDRDLIERVQAHLESKSNINFLMESKAWSINFLAACRAIVKQHIFSEPHFLVASSGSESEASAFPKLIALSNLAVLESAESVNAFINASERDVWGLVLPLHHVGGLSILIRAWDSKSEVRDLRQEKWNPISFVEAIPDVTLTSLVPTQVFDLVKLNLKAPKKLRAAFVGGAHLETKIYLQARKLGWPLLPTYGMTEMGSQIASASLDSLSFDAYPKLKLLTHLQARESSDSYLEVKSKSMMSGFWRFDNGHANFEAADFLAWHRFSDLVEIRDNCLTPLGRDSDFIKILGEGVNLRHLEQKFQTYLSDSYENFSLDTVCLISIPDPRRGAKLWVCYSSPAIKESMLLAVEKWNSLTSNHEKIEDIIFLSEFPKTDIGKISKKKIAEKLIGRLI